MGRYTVESLYFDTPDKRDFYDNELGAFCRKKIRLRSYGRDSGAVYRLEEKFREGDLTGKRSLLLTEQQARRVAAGEYGDLFTLGEMGVRFYGIMASELYRPVMAVRYGRQAYLSATNGLRVTFDYRILYATAESHLQDDMYIPAYNASEMVFEIKYSGEIPGWLADGMQKAGCVISAKSKYADNIRSLIDIAR